MRLSVDLGPDAVARPRITVAISPDGTRLAFVARGAEGVQQLATQPLDQIHAHFIMKPVRQFPIEQQQIHPIRQRLLQLLFVIDQEAIRIRIGSPNRHAQITAVRPTMTYQPDLLHNPNTSSGPSVPIPVQ